MKLSQEIKMIPSWFKDLSKAKLSKNDVGHIQYLIYVLQAVGALGLLSAFVVSVMMMFSLGGAHFGLGGVVFLYACFNACIIQVIILGIQARSKFAFMLVFSMGFVCLGAFYTWLGTIVIFYLLNQDEVVEYFFPEQKVEGAELINSL